MIFQLVCGDPLHAQARTRDEALGTLMLFVVLLHTHHKLTMRWRHIFDAL
jgi:hypothetical protein